ncbi:hypothetical protein M422DRAFT_86037, partial [Sphaerobolus stellatus SS14]
DIHKDSVYETYTHCKRNNLPEVWAYMWNSWYTPPKWRLWARSAYPNAIPCKRTTMIVEVLWRNLKRLTLHQNNCPRLDFVCHLILVTSVPAWRVKFREASQQMHSSRPHTLTAEQKSFKFTWEKLS